MKILIFIIQFILHSFVVYSQSNDPDIVIDELSNINLVLSYPDSLIDALAYDYDSVESQVKIVYEKQLEQEFLHKLKPIKIDLLKKESVINNNLISSNSVKPTLKNVHLYSSKIENATSAILEDQMVDFNANEINLKNPVDQLNLKKKINFNEIPDKALLDESKNKLNGIKKKYNEVADSRSLIEANKRNSLKNYSFIKRFESGISIGNFSYEPIRLNVIPTIGYRINKKLSFGSGIILDPFQSMNEVFFGYNAYCIFKISKPIYIVSDYLGQSNNTVDNENKKVVQGEINIGLGTEMKVINSFWIRSSIMYSVFQQDIFNTNLSTPFSVLIGIYYFKQ